MTSHYLNQWWLDYQHIYASLCLNELTHSQSDFLLSLVTELHLIPLPHCQALWFILYFYKVLQRASITTSSITMWYWIWHNNDNSTTNIKLWTSKRWPLSCCCKLFGVFLWYFCENLLHYTVTLYYVNSLWPSDAIWWLGSGSTLAQVMSCCLVAPSHYLNQYWLIITKVQWH